MQRVTTPRDVLYFCVRAMGELHVDGLSGRERRKVRRIASWLLARAGGAVFDRVGELLQCDGVTVINACRRVDAEIASGRSTELVDALVNAIALLAEQPPGDELRMPGRVHGGRRKIDAPGPKRETPVLTAACAVKIPIVQRFSCPTTRPCPHAGCRHHLPTSCVLDVVALGPASTATIAGLLGLTDFHVWKLIERGTRRARKVAIAEDWNDENPQRRAHAWEPEDRDVRRADIYPDTKGEQR